MANSFWNPYARRRRLRRRLNILIYLWIANTLFIFYLIARDK